MLGSGAIGLSFNLGSTTPVAATLAASRSRAWSNGWGTTYYDTHVTAGQALNLATGRDLTLKGAKASGTSVIARVGSAGAGNLTIASPQDEAHYTSKDSSAGFSVSVPLTGGGALSGTLSYANARLLADWQSVREQTAIVAGTGGYDINVNGHTHLKGGALSSETTANRLVTQSFTHEAVTNRDYVSGSASTVGLSIGADPNKPGLGGSSLGWASVNRSSVAHTTAAVAAGTLTVTRPDLNATRFASIRAQDKAPLLARRTALQAQLDELLAEGLLRASPAKDGVLGTASYTASSTAPPKAPTPDQPIEPYPGWWTAVTALRTQIAKVDSQIRANDARVLQDQATVSRNPSTSHQPLLHTFDAAKASAQLKTDAAITAAFGREAFKTVGTQADKLRDAAEATCKGNAASPACAEVDKWAEGGRYRTALHAAVGGVSFGAAGAAGVVASAAAQQVLSESLTKALAAVGITDPTAVNTIRGVMSLAAGAAAGGAAGAATGFNVDANNRQLHPSEKERVRLLAAGDPAKQQRLAAAACYLVRCSAEHAPGTVEFNAGTQMERMGAGMPAEIALLRAQTDGTTPMFTYSFWDRTKDTFKYINNKHNVLQNAGAIAQLAANSAGVLAGATMMATGVASCAPTVGGGCALAVAGGSFTFYSLDQGKTGLLTLGTQTQQHTLGAVLISEMTGISREAAELWYAIPGVATGLPGVAAATAETQRLAARYANAAATYFVPKGIEATPDVMASPAVQAMIREIQASTSLSAAEAAARARGWVQTGTALPQEVVLLPDSLLVKAVPKGATVSTTTPYWMPLDQATAIAKMPTDQIGQVLGLPKAQVDLAIRNGGFDFYSISPVAGARPSGFVSVIAEVEDRGLYMGAGGARQVIVPDRSRWTSPVKLDGQFPRRIIPPPGP